MFKSSVLFEQLDAYRGRIALGFVFIVVANGFELAWPWILRQAIDDLTVGSLTHPLELYAAAILALAVGAAAFRFLTRMMITATSRLIEYRMRNKLFAHLERLEAGFFQSMRTGDLIARATNDLNAVRQLLGPGIQNIFNTLVIFTVAMVLMFSISARLAAYSALILPMLTVVFLVFRARIERRFRAVQDQFGAMSNQAQENFSGIRVVKAYAQEPSEIDDFSRVSREYARRSMAQARVSGLLWPLMTVLSGLAVVLLIYLGGRDVIEGQLTLGQFVQFYAYLGMLTWPMIAMGWVVNLVQQGTAALKRVEEVLSREPAIVSGERAMGRVGDGATGRWGDGAVVRWGDGASGREGDGTATGSLEFQGVGLTLNGTPILRDINLRVPAGATLAIVGPVGSGKSSLVSLLPRIYDPTEGRILLDGIDLRNLDVEELRRMIGFVAQETFLFSASLEENVALGVETYRHGDLAEVVRTAQLEKDLEQFPRGLQTIIGERGVTLSGGQKQRTALARALLKDPTVLVLDDALSSVDASTEAAILKGLREFMRDRTSIVISHRISAILGADLIVVLDEGRIAERGTHQELLARQGLYAKMYQRQLMQEEMEVMSDE